jgi:hypothetical protein
MSILKDMHQEKAFRSPYDYRELLRMLSEAIQEGLVEEIPNTWKGPGRFVRWFREKSTGVVYALGEPEGPSAGSWRELEPNDLFPDAIIAPISRLPN